jgi:hypothetical protein
MYIVITTINHHSFVGSCSSLGYVYRDHHHQSSLIYWILLLLFCFFDT